jgi:hypothetical protein
VPAFAKPLFGAGGFGESSFSQTAKAARPLMNLELKPLFRQE